jgi:hypothetical protein
MKADGTCQDLREGATMTGTRNPVSHPRMLP